MKRQSNFLETPSPKKLRYNDSYPASTNALSSQESSISQNKTFVQQRSNQTEETSSSTLLSQRKTEVYMTTAQAQAATACELREEIKRAETLETKNGLTKLKCILGEKIDATYSEILFLAHFYQERNDLQNMIKCYDRVLYLENLPNSNKKDILILLIKVTYYICNKDANYSHLAIDYCYKILELVDAQSPQAIDTYELLIAIHHNVSWNKEQFESLNKKILFMPTTQQERKNQAFDCILDSIFFNKDLDTIFKELYFFSLELTRYQLNNFLLIIIDKISAQINDKSIPLNQKISGINTLIKIYKNNNDQNAILHYEQAIECCRHILKIRELNNKDKFEILKELSIMYLKSNDIVKAIKTYEKSVVIGWDEDFIETFLSDPRIQFLECLNVLRQMEESKKRILLAELAYNSALWYGPHKLTLTQWNNICKSDFNEHTIWDLIMSQYISDSLEEEFSEENGSKIFLNKSIFFKNNVNIESWNILTLIDDAITEESWTELLQKTEAISNEINHNNIKYSENINIFINRCLNSKTAETDDGYKIITNRIFDIMDCLKFYYNEMHTNELLDIKTKESYKQMLIQSIDIMVEGGKKCPDLAIATLTDLENHTKLFRHSDYQANILINMFKLWCIQHKITNNNQPEQTETYLYYALEFNSLLGLGLGNQMIKQTMYFPEHAILISQAEALTKLSTMFTAENLILFTSNLSIFRIIFEKEKEAVLVNKQQEYLNTYNLKNEVEAEQLRVQITEELKVLPEIFYKNKAIELYLKAGFLFRKEI